MTDVDDDVESYDVDDDSAVVVVDEVFKGAFDDNYDDGDDAAVVNVIGGVKGFVLKEKDDNDGGDDHCRDAWRSALMHIYKSKSR